MLSSVFWESLGNLIKRSVDVCYIYIRLLVRVKLINAVVAVTRLTQRLTLLSLWKWKTLRNDKQRLLLTRLLREVLFSFAARTMHLREAAREVYTPRYVAGR